MSLIFSVGGLADVRPPCVLQSFINHGAILHKVFVVGDRHFCVERPSLKNFASGPCGQSLGFWACSVFSLLVSASLAPLPDRKTIFFNSHQVSKPESSSDLTAVSSGSEEHPPGPPPWCDLLVSPPQLDEQMPHLPPPSSEAVAALVRELRSQLGMALFGVDVIINIHTHTLTVIDINVFPGSPDKPGQGGLGGSA